MVEKIPVPDTWHAPAEWFTGDVFVTPIYAGDEPSRARLSLVRFTPGARTAWHRHALGQTLHVTDGIGFVQARGGEVITMRAGDTVYISPNEWHWHGATRTTMMCHLALWEGNGPAADELETVWGNHVTDVEYPREGVKR